MLNQLKKIKNEGFTIIEVMIVLAIAGLIILVVLLAVPALQRNGRNTALKNDASAVAAGVAEYRSNNDGANPTIISETTVGATTDAGRVDIKIQGATTITAVDAPAVGTLGYHIGAKCFGGGSARSLAIYYGLEGTGGLVVTKCVDA